LQQVNVNHSAKTHRPKYLHSSIVPLPWANTHHWRQWQLHSRNLFSPWGRAMRPHLHCLQDHHHSRRHPTWFAFAPLQPSLMWRRITERAKILQFFRIFFLQLSCWSFESRGV